MAVLLPAAWPLPAASAADEPTPGEILLDDPPGDVSAVAGGPPVPLGAPYDGVDLTKARLHGETGESLRITLNVKDLKAEQSFPRDGVAFQGIDVGACFKLGGAHIGVLVQYVAGARSPIPPKVGTVTACTATALTFAKPSPAVTLHVDVLESQFNFVLPRRGLAALGDGTPLAAGTPVTEFFAFARDHRNVGGNRFDAAGPSGDTLSLVYPTANQDLRMTADVNVNPLPCGQNRDLPTYAIEAGGKRGIPVTVSNLATSARNVLFAVGTIGGPDWKAKVMPGIEIPASDGTKPGNLTVNVIVDTPSSTKHRECTTLLVRAIDATNPAVVGETSVNVVAAVAPSPERRTLHLHADALATNVCAGEHVWMNVEDADPRADGAREILLNSCEETVPLSLASSILNVALDVNPNRDLVLNTSAAGKNAEASLTLRSDGPPMRARITTALLAVHKGGAERLGETFTDVALTSTATPVALAIPVDFTREFVPTGDPSRVVGSTSTFVLSIRYEPLPADSTASDFKPAGMVYLQPDASTLTLPIFATIKRNTNDPGASGALLGLKALSPLEAFANPGKLRLYNFTVLNEGAATDVAVVTATVQGGKPWNVQVVPPGPFKLDAGRGQAFTVGIEPPADAPESDSARVEVTVSSESDPTARSVAILTLTATRSQEIGSETFVDVAPPAGKGGLPGPSLVLVLLGLAVALAALRRF